MAAPSLIIRPTAALTTEERRALRELLDTAFGERFSDEDWDHTLGGHHVVVSRDGLTLAHAAVVPRRLQAGDRSLETGYVEGVATRPDAQRQGFGRQAMQAAGTIIDQTYDLGALSTGRHDFYRRLGWEPWQGPSYVQAATGRIRTADEDDGIMVLRTDRTRDLDLTTDLTCEWRPGDVW